MPAAPPESPVTEGVRTLEVRWIFPGQLETAVAGWFGRFPARTESREDTYLLAPQLPRLSVKVRGGGALEVKVYRGRAASGQLRYGQCRIRQARQQRVERLVDRASTEALCNQCFPGTQKGHPCR